MAPARRIAVATSAALPGLDPDSVPLLAALRERGVDARPQVWSDAAVDWRAFDAVLVRSTWDYAERLEEFLSWLHALPVPVLNPKRVIAWNAHKGYLRELAAHGVPTVDTLWVDRGGCAEVPWPDAVVKPAVGASARGLRRGRGGEAVEAGADDLLVQPLLESIATEGELSLVYAAGELSHAVRKRPKPGDIRVQPEWGGTIVPAEPGPEALAVAGAACAAAGEPLLYARVDLVRAADGTLRLIELEAIEPQLFLTWSAGAADRFAGAFSAAFARLP